MKGQIALVSSSSEILANAQEAKRQVPMGGVIIPILTPITIVMAQGRGSMPTPLGERFYYQITT